MVYKKTKKYIFDISRKINLSIILVIFIFGFGAGFLSQNINNNYGFKQKVRFNNDLGIAHILTMVKKVSYNIGKPQKTIHFRYEIADFNYVEKTCEEEYKLKDTSWAMTKKNCDYFNKKKESLNHLNYERLKDFDELKIRGRYVEINFEHKSGIIDFFTRRLEMGQFALTHTDDYNLFMAKES